MTEVDGDAEELFETSVVLPEKVVVGGHGEPLGITLLDTQACLLHFENGDDEYLLNERDAKLPVDNGEEYAGSISAREDEVRFGVTHATALIDN